MEVFQTINLLWRSSAIKLKEFDYLVSTTESLPASVFVPIYKTRIIITTTNDFSRIEKKTKHLDIPGAHKSYQLTKL